MKLDMKPRLMNGHQPLKWSICTKSSRGNLEVFLFIYDILSVRVITSMGMSGGKAGKMLCDKLIIEL